MNEKIIELAAKVLGVDLDVVRQHNKYVAEIAAWYCWSPERGGQGRHHYRYGRAFGRQLFNLFQQAR